MPSALTHYLFAIQSLERDQQLPFLFLHEDVVRVGTQGPDPFFFYGFVPWIKREDKSICYGYGSFLHAINPAITLVELIKVASNETGELKDLYFAYLYGLFLHYVLDRTVHPYVYYRSGFDSEGELTDRYLKDHARFESFMDAALLHSTIWNHPKLSSYKAIKANSRKIKLVSTIFSKINNPKVKSMHFYEAWMDMKRIEKVLFDPLGVKRWFLIRLGVESSLMVSMMVPPRIPKHDFHDYLNITNQVWKNPVTGKVHNDSLLDMINQAHQLRILVVNELMAVYQGNEIKEDFWENLFQTINFDGVPENQKRTISESIYL